MVVLTGKNLGERHRELNQKVAEVIASKKNFNDIKDDNELCDVDKLYKIDIALQYKDMDYIVEILKSGDSLYISRALKFLWLHHDTYSHIVNIEYLQKNIIPFMSIKMKKKLLSAISIHMQNNDIAAYYFIYCKKNKMPKIALKFLNITSEEFKLDILKNENKYKNLNLYSYIEKQNNLQNFVGNSFLLATACIELFKFDRNNILYNLRYLYSVNNKKYLDILEKFIFISLKSPNSLTRLGIRISRDIMINHKNRVLENPLLYVHELNKGMLVKYSSKSEAKKYIKSLFPQDIEEFWQIDFCTTYNFIINMIPLSEKFEYIKHLYTTNYSEKDFEMTLNFYKKDYYSMFSPDQRELWALRHINEQTEILGTGNDYLWYKFVNIDKALIEISKYIYMTPDSNKRSNIVKVLVVAARDQKDLKKLLGYYYERHINENETHKTDFIDKLFSVHNVFELNIECWEMVNKLFHSLGIYTVGRNNNKVFVAVAVACHILHSIDMPQALLDFIDLDVNYFYFTLLLQKLGQEKSIIVYHHLLNLFVAKLKPFEQDPNNKAHKENLMKNVNNIFQLLSCFKKEDKECPEIVTKFMNIHAPRSKKCKNVNVEDIRGFIKTDAILVVDALEHFDLNINDWPKKLNSTFRKLKVYFHNDIAQTYINFLVSLFEKASNDYKGQKLINSVIFSLFQLTDENFKVTLMENYRPSNPKIDYGVIDKKLLHIQEAICKFVGYSRPPVPMQHVFQYVKGDYLKYSLPLFGLYLVNLPLPLLMKFIEGTLNAPLSMQKHSLRLAFQCYTSENLKQLVLTIWKKTKNISLRKMVYELLFHKLMRHTEVDEKDVRVLYEALKFCTSDLHEDDHENLFILISSGLVLDTLKYDYLQTVWDMVIRLPKKPVNIRRQTQIVRYLENNFTFLQRDFIRKSIIDKHIDDTLEHKNLHLDELQNFRDLWHAKWNLTVKYILKYKDNEELEQNMTLLNLILKKCVDMWDYRYNETYIYKDFFFIFIGYIKDKVIYIDGACNVPILKRVLDILYETFPLKEIYLLVWDLKLIICIINSLSYANTVFYDTRQKALRWEDTQNVSDNFVSHFNDFVQELLAKHQFFPVYLPEIATLLKCKLSNVEIIRDNMQNFIINLCLSLTNIGLKETHLLTLMILPKDTAEETRNIHSQILEKVLSFEDEEVQSFIHFKFFAKYDITSNPPSLCFGKQ